ncbi:hypothetical protein HRR83_006679 [Exophiala dermatitidis]|uniref:Phospholipase/carboxylesterase/thioesterase domain-containing protein n=2 Tax=Exophiala dermatitidis TaxID=5970 RepID=H6BVR4_EXODN|nr:uncharacterized protein HMPREF1120_04049 [Exophiala dermatitidis NIH/UT8656]KAJ4511426.1 hypothetical protein HRR75_005352 [Exophiala dermatitidis]EHY55940.1 hypothetical protein HMPREF1120_04049 [Exophiala dermatitidis NIH/UT8656]KAJ4514180.1 hypothetical protein HRR74_005839 [Exophiala dermatitidis]KAJ4515336.1 hypothetical protein HRR73_005167 [Exophiala dermatitidis]KAJ4533829.1 hypothetical protein HRR77_008313 [Exophiala dermatitidis]
MTRPSPGSATGKARDDPEINPNSFHDFHMARRRPKNVPDKVIPVMATSNEQLEGQQAAAVAASVPKHPGHPYAETKHIKYDFFNQRTSNAPFGYEHFVSVPPNYDEDVNKKWPLILFLHGAGQSQRGRNESYFSLRHGIPKVILCYDQYKARTDSGGLTENVSTTSSSPPPPSINIPVAERFKRSKQTKQGDKSYDPVPIEVCELVAENFITVTPSLNMDWGYGWNASILSALLDEIVQRYNVDLDRIHVTGFSMGGYGTWELALHTPHRFATVMPICGGGDDLRVSHIKHLPHWIHHGDLDDIIPLRASQKMVTALQKAGAPDVNFTRYPDLKHDSWTAAYNNPEVYRWMLGHRRQVKGDEEVVPVENKVVVG